MEEEEAKKRHHMREMGEDIMACYRESHPKPRTLASEMACFLATTYACKWGTVKTDEHYEKAVKRYSKLLALNDCPAMETIQLQVIDEATTRRELGYLEKENAKRRLKVNELLSKAINIKVLDVREVNSVIEKFHSSIKDFIMETSRQMDETLSPGSVNEAEMHAALDSVFPLTHFLHWMDLPDLEKISQLQELRDIIPGICIYNRDFAKVGSRFPLPSCTYEREMKLLQSRAEEELCHAKSRAFSYTRAINLHIDKLGMRHVLMQRLRDELAYDLQISVILHNLLTVLHNKTLSVTALWEKCSQHLQTLHYMVGQRSCVPTELVYPQLRAIGLTQRAISDELRILRAQSKATSQLFSIIENPSYKRTPTGLADLSSYGGLEKLRITINNCGFLPPEIYNVNIPDRESTVAPYTEHTSGAEAIVIEADQMNQSPTEVPELQLGGYCAVAYAKNQGLLLHGDPKIGLVKIQEKVYAFSSKSALDEFCSVPSHFLQMVEDIAIMLPQTINLLNLQNDVKYSCCGVSMVIDILCNDPLEHKISTQTDDHILPPHQWDEDTLLERVLQLSTKQTHSSQTDNSLIQRDSTAQVWQLKEKSTQSCFVKGTSMPRRVRYFHNLRGPPNCKFSISDLTLEV